jgi:type I restriction enzyme M protein
MSRIQMSVLESYLWEAANVLRGHMGAAEYKQYIFPMLFWKRISDTWDEEREQAIAEVGADFSENHRIQVPEDAHWDTVRNRPNDVGAGILNAMRLIETANPSLLSGVFGDAHWTNKEKLPDATLKELIEHFSSLKLTTENLPEDELGTGYEYLIRKFADDSGHTAAEFYTNRTVVHLMIEMLKPKSGEDIYDPTCGSGGMLISSLHHIKQSGGEHRNIGLYGQEINLLTSAIARMNLFLHGVEDFHIERGDTLGEPKFVEGGALKQFDLVLANPPYSIKQWDRAKWASDKWGRNKYGTPPQGNADYAFFQHIIASTKPNSGRSAILYPHGILFRDQEKEMREKIVAADLVECVIGLGPNLFYNSPMKSCIVICRSSKPADKKNKVLFINAVEHIREERNMSYLDPEHILAIAEAYNKWENVEGFSRVVELDEIRANHSRLSIPLYVKTHSDDGDQRELPEVLGEWLQSSNELRASMDDLFEMLDEFNDIKELST